MCNVLSDLHYSLIAIKILHEHISLAALHNSKARRPAPRCYPNTRVSVIDTITEWVSNVNSPDGHRILWLHGPLGSGKSTIAQTLAEHYTSENNRKLAGSFFFSSAAPDRNTDQNFIATLAHQFVCSIRGIDDSGTVLGPVVKANPLIFNEPLEEQIRLLIVEPMMQAVSDLEPYTWPYLVIIDGIDECTEKDTQRQIVSTIGAAIEEHKLPLQFIITSRLEFHLKKLFSGEIKHISKHMSLQDSQFNPETDIAHYLGRELTRIWKGSLPDELNSDIRAILDRSGGQFLYPSMVIEFIENPRHQPDEQLKIMVDIPVVHGDPTSPFAELDCLHDILGVSVNEVTSMTIYGIPYRACVYKHLLVDSREALFPYLITLSTEQIRALIQDGHDVYKANIHRKQ